MKTLFYLGLTLLVLSQFIYGGFVYAQNGCRSELNGHCVEAAAVVQAQIRGLEFLDIPQDADIGNVLSRIYVFGLGLVGLAALIMFILGGVLYLTAGDSQSQVGKAKSYMGNAVWGLVLALLSWLILFTINPNLVKKINLKLRPISLTDEELRNIPKPANFIGSDKDWDFIKGGGVNAATGVKCADGRSAVGGAVARKKLNCEYVRIKIRGDPSLKSRGIGIGDNAAPVPYETWKEQCNRDVCMDIDK
ncbi:MAG: hypothetical protein HYW89_02595 [Candidatus Sungiibacteriota bacterium]|uniref:Uncharacterized protein n=1 Tax=Candidatus Sungiibacteriota bacterium TaxID=2750080 RepID=A0A7T5RIT6_9BACT|nr:MAG: hypothetical protein HYW89_02595 [Candidatus Sungbacteria bacterium]